MDPRDRPDWQPATSAPGEIYTAEGEIAGIGAFVRGLRNRRSMARVGLWFLLALVALAAVLTVLP